MRLDDALCIAVILLACTQLGPAAGADGDCAGGELAARH